MIFLIQYDPRTGNRPVYRIYPDSERAAAQDARLELELKMVAEGCKDEVVILEAVDEAQVRRTHRRYYPDQEELFAEVVAELKAQYCAVGSQPLAAASSK